MTKENCLKMLNHFNKIADGTITAPIGHAHWGLVMANAKRSAEDMKTHILKSKKFTASEKAELFKVVEEA